ncbi:MAG: response regulator [Alphaproteobacteria bacterium]
MARNFDFSNLAVMVVDDNQYMLHIVKAVLNSMRIKEVHGFTDAADAFADLMNWYPDVIFTDSAMDPLNGLEFVKLIRSSKGPIQFVPLIVLTGHADRRLVQQARDSGADYTLRKPVALDGVYKTFVHMVEKNRVFVESALYFGPERRKKQRPFDGPDRRNADVTPQFRTPPPRDS